MNAANSGSWVEVIRSDSEASWLSLGGCLHCFNMTQQRKYSALEQLATRHSKRKAAGTMYTSRVGLENPLVLAPASERAGKRSEVLRPSGECLPHLMHQAVDSRTTRPLRIGQASLAATMASARGSTGGDP